jgi:hypothetical protein
MNSGSRAPLGAYQLTMLSHLPGSTDRNTTAAVAMLWRS